MAMLKILVLDPNPKKPIETVVAQYNPKEVQVDHSVAWNPHDKSGPLEYKTRVFDEHFRAHAAHDASLGVNGLGLGLTIVKDCLRSISGTIALESREGEGSVFTVTFPDAAAVAG